MCLLSISGTSKQPMHLLLITYFCICYLTMYIWKRIHTLITCNIPYIYIYITKCEMFTFVRNLIHIKEISATSAVKQQEHPLFFTCICILHLLVVYPKWQKQPYTGFLWRITTSTWFQGFTATCDIRVAAGPNFLKNGGWWGNCHIVNFEFTG